MHEHKRDRAWAFSVLGFGVGAVIAVIAAPGLPFWSLFLLIAFAGTCITAAAHYFGWITLHISADDPKRTALLLLGIWLPAGVFIYGQWPREAITIYYNGSPLKGKTVVLEKSCVPASSVQPYMCVDHNPNSFDLFGISMIANRTVQAQFAVLEFETKVISRSSPPWQSSSLDGMHYGCPLSNITVPTDLPIRVEPFYAESESPLSASGTKITLTLFYESTMTTTTFTLKPPN
jgi:hypothetical protein